VFDGNKQKNAIERHRDFTASTGLIEFTGFGGFTARGLCRLSLSGTSSQATVVDSHVVRYPGAVTWFSPGSFKSRPPLQVRAASSQYGKRDETRPVSTGRGTRRVQLVPEGGGGAGSLCLQSWFLRIGSGRGHATRPFLWHQARPSPLCPTHSFCEPLRFLVTSVQTSVPNLVCAGDWVRMGEREHGAKGLCQVRAHLDPPPQTISTR